MILSKKHGLNPSLQLCFFCGEVKDVLLLGRLLSDAEAPRVAVSDYEPCEHCVEVFKQGMLVIEVTEKQPADKRPAIQAGAYPTGHYWVLSNEASIRLLGEPTKVMLITLEGAKELGLYPE